MNDSPPRRRLAHAVGDVAILLTIMLTTWAVLQIQIHDRYVERGRGQVVYGVNAQKADAIRLAEVLVELGLFDGTKRTIRLDRNQGFHEVKVVVEPAMAAQPAVREQLTHYFRVVTQRVFGDQPTVVKLADVNLNSYDNLLTSP